ncbi:primase-helicase family protein [Pseudomonas sp. NPDC089401]|uniref:primase-helicase family protein n=1 Tax=Pseudomonas sp. NPDC089401 TaxID=3364462 RepID=UPI00380D2E34
MSSISDGGNAASGFDLKAFTRREDERTAAAETALAAKRAAKASASACITPPPSVITGSFRQALVSLRAELAANEQEVAVEQSSLQGLPSVEFGNNSTVQANPVQAAPSRDNVVKMVPKAEGHSAFKVGDIDPESREILRYISEDFILVTGDGAVYAYYIKRGCRLTKEGMKHQCAKRHGTIEQVAKIDNGRVEWKSLPAGDIWWEWKGHERRVVMYLVMEPTAVSEGDDDPDVFNLWHIRKLEMVERTEGAVFGDMTILWNHLLYLADGDTGAVVRFLCWLAWLYQHPDDKIPTAWLFYSEHRRVGKNLIGRLLARVFGPSMVLTDGDGKLLTSKFDDALLDRRIAFLNEVRLAGKERANFEVFKNRVSAEKVVIEPKGRPAREVRNTVHYILTSNHEDALPLTENEGRINVMRCLAPRKPDAYYEELVAWIDGPGAGVFANVLATWGFKNWNPHAPAPETEAARDMQLAARGPGINFLQERAASRDGAFALQIGRCQSIYMELQKLYPDLVRDYGITPQTLPKMLKSLGFTQLFKAGKDGKPSGNPNTKVWCFCNHDWWDGQLASVWNDYLKTQTAPEGMPPHGGDSHE